jgi:SSS family transporter
LSGLSLTFIVVVAVYLAAVIAIGARASRETRTEADFLLAGRSIGPWVGGAVLAATQISAGTFVGTLGRHYSTGVSWVWAWPGLWLGWLISAIWIAPKLRRFGATTVPDYVAVRFASERARVLASVLIIVPYTIYLTAQYQAAGEIFAALFGAPPYLAMGFIIASTVIYTVSGGVRSSSRVDFLQALIMVTALVLAVPLLVSRAGGIGQVGETLSSLDGRLTGWWYGPRDLVAVSLAFGLSIAAAPYELTRFYSMRDVATVRTSIGVAFLFQGLIAASVMILGLSMRALFPAVASEDQASAVMALHVLSPLIGSLFLVALLSAIMSTCNSILLVVAASLSHDLYARFVRPEASDAERVLWGRVAIVVVSLLPVPFALAKYDSVQSIVLEQGKFIASFFFVPLVLGLNWRRGTATGAVASMLGGFVACAAWDFLDFGQGALKQAGVDAVEVGLLASAALFVAGSLLTPPPPQAALTPFFPPRRPIEPS